MATLVNRGEGKIDKRYRPQRLSEVFGNHSLIASLKRWFSSGENRQRVIMLHGSAGTGKTTCARIISLSLNCENQSEMGEPCLECESCRSILNGTAMNIYEINMAKLNKKEDVDELVDGMYESCLTGKNKIYVFDECQQLTNSAQNLLLKPLEEPPANTYFILSTTDPQKIIKPLQTRCQMFKVGNPVGEDLKDYLRQLFSLENWKISKEDANFLVENVLGCGYREIINICEQYSLGGKDAISKLNISEDPNLFQLALKVCQGDWNSFVQEHKKIESEFGFNCEQFRIILLGCLKSKLVQYGLTEKGASYASAMKCLFEPYYEPNPTSRMFENVFEVCYNLK